MRAGNLSTIQTHTEASARLDRYADDRVKLDRPLVILGGFLDIGWGPAIYKSRLQKYFDGRIIVITFFDLYDFESCRNRVWARVDKELGVVSKDYTVEVDVIGQSMGGLVGMFSEIDEPTLSKRLNIKRLYTISSPLQGSRLAAKLPAINNLHRDMRPRSDFYKRLFKHPIDYELVSYTRLNDQTVGEEYAAAPGRRVWWVDNPTGEPSHVGAFIDDRIFADIVRRLRDDPPRVDLQPPPLPSKQIKSQ